MDSNKINKLWSISLLIINIVTLIIVIPNIFGIELPDIMKRVFVIIDLIALPFVVYSTYKKFKLMKISKS
ncbi:MAG: hypothetical protein IJA34_11175 [Lachnospiraceae bacterium]|nr:hypothetical protein [Lachnospiraceae bacterium]